jgi:pyridoxamine 5'-phosphate oxidase
MSQEQLPAQATFLDMSLFASDTPRDASLADPLPDSPLPLLERWIDEARSGQVQRNPTAMTVATLGSEGDLSARVLLCRNYDAEHGFVVFYTNRESRKGDALDTHANAAAVLHWDALGRQVRIEGPILHSPDEESDAYWTSRERGAQIAAAASDQSRNVRSREALLERLRQAEAHFGGPDGPPVPRPPHWGGYRLWIQHIELWVGADNRAHDRALWSRSLEPAERGFAAGSWQRMRLQP